MAQAETIKEFLVGLGFKVDEKGMKRFSESIGESTKSVFKLVAAIQGAALTVGAGVAAFASNLETLYFAAVKTGASATNLKAFEKATANLGVASGEALGSVQALARFMRETPGAEGFLKTLGVDALNANGKLKDTTEIMRDLGLALQSKPYYIAKQYGDVLGISEDTLRAILSGDFSKKLAEQRANMKDSGFDKAAADAHKFMEGLRDLQTYLEAFAIKVQDALMKKLGVSMNSLSDWWKKNGPMIADRVADVIIMFLNLAEKIAPAIMWIVEKLIDLDKATDGWSTKIIAAVALLNVLGGTSVIAGIFALASAFGSLGTSIAGANAAASGGGLMSLLGKAGLVAGAGAAGYWAGGEIYENLGEKTQKVIGGTVATILAKMGVKSAQEAIDTDMNNMAGLSDTGKKASFKSPNSKEANAMNFFKKMGWSHDQAAGIVASIKQESSFNHKNVGDKGQAYGLAQWHPHRQADFKKWAGKDIRDSSDEEQMAFINYELTQGSMQKAGRLLRAATNAKQASDVVTQYYEIPAKQELEKSRRGASAVQIAQTTNINVTGGSDPASTGRAVAGEQNRVNETLTRNMQLASQ